MVSGEDSTHHLYQDILMNNSNCPNELQSLIALQLLLTTPKSPFEVLSFYLWLQVAEVVFVPFRTAVGVALRRGWLWFCGWRYSGEATVVGTQ